MCSCVHCANNDVIIVNCLKTMEIRCECVASIKIQYIIQDNTSTRFTTFIRVRLKIRLHRLELRCSYEIYLFDKI